MGKQSLANGVVGALAITAVVGCGEPFMLLETSPSGSGGASGGSTSASMGTTSSSSGGSLDNCSPGDLVQCGPGNYCKRSGEMKTCAACSELTELKFGKPTKIALTLPGTGTAPRYPRIGPGNQLLFTFTAQANGPDIGHATASVPLTPLSWGKGETDGIPINTAKEEAASFYIPKQYGTMLEGVADSALRQNEDILLYHSNPQLNLKIVAYNPGRTNVAPVFLVDGDTNSNITAAYKAMSPRLWYMSTAKGPVLGLVTALPGYSPEAVPIYDHNDCEVKGNISPWVTPDGKWLFFSAPQMDKDKSCMPVIAPDPYRIYYTALDDKGLASGRAAQVEFLDDPQGHATPSLSPDLCMIFFTKQFEKGNSELYAAIRE